MEWALEMPALGRPFQLGMLYDCRRDSLIPGVTLWEADILQKEVRAEARSQWDCQVLPSESLQSKASALQLSGSLKASFFGGLFEVGGAATYLQKKQPSMNDACKTLHLSVTTERKYLPTDLLHRGSVSYQEAFEERSATHVVTEVLYGAQAFFVFNCGVSESEDVQDVQRHLLEMMEKIPKAAAGGRDAPGWSDAERQMEGKIHSTVYSDISMKNPTTFREAFHIYASFPQMFRECGKVVPVKVWLYPLSKLEPKSARIVQDPPLGWLKEAEAHLQALIEVDITCNDLIKSPVAISFPEMTGQLEQLKQLCGQHGHIFQQEVGKALLAIRAGKEEAAVLWGVLMRVIRSPFHKEALKELLARKKQKMDFVKFCLSCLKGLEVVPAWKLDEILFEHRNKIVVAFMLTSLEREEPSLDELRDWLQRPHLGGNGESVTAAPYSKKNASKLWFEDEGRKHGIRCAISSLLDFAKIHQERGNFRFLVSSVWDESHPGASVYLYENGILVNSHLELLSRPAPPEIELVQPDRVWVTIDRERESRAECGPPGEEGQQGRRWQQDRGHFETMGQEVRSPSISDFSRRKTPQEGQQGRRWQQDHGHFETMGQEVRSPSISDFSRRKTPQVPELRIVLVGKTGTGRSATGNTILGSQHFRSEMGLQTVTRKCERWETELNAQKIVVVDTPGFFGTQLSEAEISAEVEKCVQLCPPGPHAIIHVVKVGIFTKEEKRTIQLIKGIFGKEALRYIIILFTRQEDLEGESLESFISGQDKMLKAYTDECENRYLAFNNKAEKAERQAQVNQLIQMIEDLVEKNQSDPYYIEKTQKGSSSKFSWHQERQQRS